MPSKKVELSRLYLGVRVKDSYDGTSLHLRRVEYEVSVGTPVAAEVTKCLYSFSVPSTYKTDEDVLREVKRIDAIVSAALSLIVRHPFVVFDEDEKVDGQELRVEIDMQTDWRFWHRYQDQPPEPPKHWYILLEQSSVEAWDKVSSTLLNDERMFKLWFTSLSWLQQAHHAESYYDALIYAWIAFNSLFKRANAAKPSGIAARLNAILGRKSSSAERRQIAKFIDDLPDNDFCAEYLSNLARLIDKLAVTSVGRNLPTAIQRGNPKESTKSVLFAIYSVRSSLVHADRIYEGEERRAEVEAAALLLLSFMSRYLMTVLYPIGEKPNFSTSHAGISWSFSITLK